MSKSKKAAKRKRQEEGRSDVANKRQHGPPTPESQPEREPSQPQSLHAIVYPDEMEVTIDTLRILSEHSALIKSKACKDLRTAVFDFRQVCTTGINTVSDTNLTSRISAALVDERYTEALVLLAEMRIRRESPKLGALCRWVRDLDVTSGFSARQHDRRAAIQRTSTQLERLRVLDAISRVTGTVDRNPSISYTISDEPFILHDPWDLRLTGHKSDSAGTEIQDRHDNLKEKFTVLEKTSGADRKPPNKHDAVLYLSEDNTIALSQEAPQVKRHEHAAVPNLSIMQDVLSRNECQRIVAAMETVGFLPDAPIRDDGSEASILAHNVYWVVDQAFHDSLWARVQPFVPKEMGGRQVRGINRRFRVYRYVPGAEYRVHFDGAWPPSGVDSHSGKYLWDASPPDAKQSSLFTFLVYLNDDFEGGETTFFTPSPVDGVMNAHPVKPLMGSIALFPHGDAQGALLHEGTGVIYGAKYIIRTDVEYDVLPAGAP